MIKQNDQIRQIVPPSLCSVCDVCCRFPEKDSFLAPYFTPEEISAAAPTFMTGHLQGMNPRVPAGCKVTLVPHNEGYICPAFNPESSTCRIYTLRPLDCRLYPFAVMWDISGRTIVLGMDSKCPFVREREGAECVMQAADEIADTLESSPLLEIFAENRGLIGPYQDDVIPLIILNKLTTRYQLFL